MREQQHQHQHHQQQQQPEPYDPYDPESHVCYPASPPSEDLSKTFTATCPLQTCSTLDSRREVDILKQSCPYGTSPRAYCPANRAHFYESPKFVWLKLHPYTKPNWQHWPFYYEYDMRRNDIYVLPPSVIFKNNCRSKMWFDGEECSAKEQKSWRCRVG